MPDDQEAVLHIDVETRSEVDLAAVGQDAYAAHPSTEVLCICYSIGSGPVKTLYGWSQGEVCAIPCPDEIKQHLELCLPVCAHNCAFELAIWRHILAARHAWPMPHLSQWRDTMALAAIATYPQSLGKCAEALGLSQQKDDDGRRVMLKWCKPRKPTKSDPSMWCYDLAEFDVLCAYCAQDVETERAIYAELHRYMKPAELAVFQATLRMNERGIPVDLDGAAAAQRIIGLSEQLWEQRLQAAFGPDMTLDTLRSRQDFMQKVRQEGGLLSDVKGANLEAALKRAKTDKCKLLLQARIAISRTSTAKVSAILERQHQGVVRDGFVYHGASTGRWTAKGIQPQNLPRDAVPDVDACLADAATLDAETFDMLYGEPADAIAGCLRGLIKAPEGYILVASDYAQIEARVLLWLAGDTKHLKIFAQGGDIYKDMAATIYDTTPEAVTKAQRMLGKVAILGLGYGMGKDKFYETCRSFGINVEPEISDAAVTAYRKKYQKVKTFWRALESACVDAILEPGKPVTLGRLKVLRAEDTPRLMVRLPSGRLLHYQQVSTAEDVTPWGDPCHRIKHYGTNQVTRQWAQSDTYGGKLVENVCQAVARDIMAHALLKTEAAGLAPIMTVHDEIVCMVSADEQHPAKKLDKALLDLPAWADGLPLAVDSWTATRYRK